MDLSAITPDTVLFCMAMVIVIAWRSYYVGYNDAINDARKTGRFPELEDE